MTHEHEQGLQDSDGNVAPAHFLIAHDDYHAKYVGTASSGHQFFITTPFTWGVPGHPGEEFVARYLFDDDGTLADAKIVALGARPGDGALPGNLASFAGQDDAISELLEEIAPVTYGDITIAPFSVPSHGRQFGFVLNGPEHAEDDEWWWSVNIEPGDYMAFNSPWDDGEYDT